MKVNSILNQRLEKIAIISIHGRGDGMGSRTRIKSMVYALNMAYGHERVDWINFYACGIDYIKRRKQVIAEYKNNNHNFTLIPFPFPRKRRFRFLLSPFLHFLIFMILFLRYGKGTGILLWVEMTESAWSVLLYKKIFSVPLIIDLHAIVDEAVQFENKSIKTAWRYSLSVFKNTVTLWSAEGLVAVSNKLLSIYKRRLGSLAEHTVVIPCVVDCRMFRFDANVRRTMRETLGLERSFVFVYAGGTQSWQCLDDMLSLFDRIQRSDLFKDFHPLFLLLVWDASFSLEERARKLNITTTNIFLYNLPHEKIPGYLQASDAAFLFRKDITTNLVSSPTKVGEYLASGVPIITTPFVGDASDIIQKGNIGFILDLDKQCDLKNLQEWCLQVQRTRDQVAFRCTEIAQLHFGEAQLSKVKEILQQF